MKQLDTVFVVAGLLSLSVLVAVSSCDEGDQINEAPIKPTRQHVASALQSSHWNVAYYFKDKDETEQFTGFSFTFQGDGTVQVVRNNVTLAGSWSSFQAPSDQLKLNLEFQPVESFNLLNSDWVVVEQSDQRIRLEDVVANSEMTLERI
ncbi:MAG TPA: hypothetical protein VD927_04985 [Chryseosolibacter sp.]|nr:hypothetical protein [Chryseosolibacter sp.]